MVAPQRLELGPVEHRQDVNGEPGLEQGQLARARFELGDLAAGPVEVQGFDRRPRAGLTGPSSRRCGATTAPC
ncbi:MAG: hypothetical protein AAFX50_22940 [Acidobacteriota bacterium]